MKDSPRSTDIMYARLKKIHHLSHAGVEGTGTLTSGDYSFLYELWLICDTMQEWDNLVRKFKQKNGY